MCVSIFAGVMISIYLIAFLIATTTNNINRKKINVGKLLGYDIVAAAPEEILFHLLLSSKIQQKLFLLCDNCCELY
jgi:hypothetical protein